MPVRFSRYAVYCSEHLEYVGSESADRFHDGSILVLPNADSLAIGPGVR
jgi:hypothetical protein